MSLTSPVMNLCECSAPDNTSGDEKTTRPTISNVGKGAMGNNSIAIGAALGEVSAVLLLTLMGVVMGWVSTTKGDSYNNYLISTICWPSNCSSLNARADNTTTNCNTEVNVCYNKKAVISADNTPINLNTKAMVWLLEALH